MNRRDFIQKTMMATMVVASSPKTILATDRNHLTILYTNDWHSRIDPFPLDGSKNQGLGGAAKRAFLIKKIREENPNVILLDAGDIFQGTPYFNVYGGELEFKLMSAMGYDAATMGNHDFDAGMEGFLKQLPNANFPFIVSNYNFDNTILKGKTIPYKIFRKGKYKIGVLGLGIQLEGLVTKQLYGNTEYKEPIAIANEIAAFLKHKNHCDLVICLSHLGYEYKDNKVSDLILASKSENIDIIIGGHTHTFLKQPNKIINNSNQTTWVCQTGWAGINLGRIDYKTDSFLSASNPHFSMLEIC